MGWESMSPSTGRSKFQKLLFCPAPKDSVSWGPDNAEMTETG